MRNKTLAVAEKVSSRLEYIDATKAANWLSRNVRNRPLRTRLLKRISDQIRRGEWELNGESIIWANDNTIIDGQHRLQAIVDAGVSAPGLPCIVVYGVSPDAYKSIDSGASRLAKDDLGLLGYVNTTILAAAAAMLHTFRNFGTMLPAGQNRPTRAQTVQMLMNEPTLADSVKMADNIHRRMPNMFKTQTIVLHHLFSEIDPELNELFWTLIVEGAELPKDSPILALRNRINGFAGSRMRNAYTAAEYGALVIKAWNAWIVGQKVAILRWKGIGKFSEDFPQISGNVTRAMQARIVE